jgi:AcrR family transcriptional regulator
VSKTRQSSGASGTREALILAAERLIAEHGIDGVSLRQINTEAGQRNSSAAHYHFGSKDALIRSIYEYRLDSVNRRRQQLLEEVRAGGQDTDVRSLVETFIQPIIEEIRSSDGGSFYIRFLSQAIGHPLADVREYSETMLTGAAMSAYDLLKAALPDIPAPIIGQRFGLMWEMIIHALADRERYTDPESGNFEEQSELFINNLIDSVTGGLAGPVAPPTRAALSRQQRQP